MIDLRKAYPMDEVMEQLAGIALFMEDSVPDVMGGKKGYSVNLNFRKDGGVLFASVEAYGNGKHMSRTRQYPMEELRRDKRNRNAVIGAVVAGVLTAILIALIK